MEARTQTKAGYFLSTWVIPCSSRCCVLSQVSASNATFVRVVIALRIQTKDDGNGPENSPDTFCLGRAQWQFNLKFAQCFVPRTDTMVVHPEIRPMLYAPDGHNGRQPYFSFCTA